MCMNYRIPEGYRMVRRNEFRNWMVELQPGNRLIFQRRTVQAALQNRIQATIKCNIKYNIVEYSLRDKIGCSDIKSRLKIID